VVVEANPQNLPMLIGNRERNRCKFEVLHGAAGAEGKPVRIYFGNGALTASSIATTENSVEVAAVTLEDVMRERSFDSCALVCDIEGAEIRLVRSEIATFRSRVEVFIVELHPYINGPDEVDDIQNFLKANGFENVWQKGDVYVFRNTAYAQKAVAQA